MKAARGWIAAVYEIDENGIKRLVAMGTTGRIDETPAGKGAKRLYTSVTVPVDAVNPAIEAFIWDSFESCRSITQKASCRFPTLLCQGYPDFCY